MTKCKCGHIEEWHAQAKGWVTGRCYTRTYRYDMEAIFTSKDILIEEHCPCKKFEPTEE
jgi:hypothetical protein